MSMLQVGVEHLIGEVVRADGTAGFDGKSEMIIPCVHCHPTITPFFTLPFFPTRVFSRFFIL